MAGIVSSNTSPGSCGHRDVVIDVDGVPVTLLKTVDDATPLTLAEKIQLCQLMIRWRRTAHNWNLADLLNRAVIGDEATNVKIYTFFGPGAAITKTNIGTTYVNICAGANGEPVVADFTGCTEYRLRLYANLVGIGQWGARVLRPGSDVLHDAPNLGAAGERALDTNWQPLPAAFLGQGLLELVAQGKSQTAADDPVYRFLAVGLR